MTRQRRSSEEVQAESAATARAKAQRERFEARKKRGGSMSDFNKKLEVDLPLLQEIYPGMAFRWVKDQGGRVTQMYNNGWEFCPMNSRLKIGDNAVDGNTDLGNGISVIGGVDNDSAEGAYRMRLMMIPVDIWEEIKSMKQAINDEIDDSINRTLQGEGESPVERAYKPNGTGGKYQP